ncbi:hypothetical protein V1527DRAFT_478172 [Lipomyces starkeyi]
MQSLNTFPLAITCLLLWLAYFLFGRFYRVNGVLASVCFVFTLRGLVFGKCRQRLYTSLQMQKGM